MNKNDIIRKLTSRKFWLAIAAFITELIVAFKGDAETAETISGMIMAGATVIADYGRSNCNSLCTRGRTD